MSLTPITSLAPYVRILGRGPGRARALTEPEAHAAMRLILAGDAAPEAVGALLMLMRYRGEEAPEIAGFARALREILPDWPGLRPSLDWPSYAAGRSRGVPWFLLSARLVARAGYPVLLHGWNAQENPAASVRGALSHAGIAQAASVDEAAALLDASGIVYLPLECFAPRALELLRLREVLGLRSIINTVLRVLNPAGAVAAVQGVFHPPYRALQSDACAALGLENLTVIKGGGGEFERHPGKEILLHGLRGGKSWQPSVAPLIADAAARRLADAAHRPADLSRLWQGGLEDAFATAVVVGTAALALDTLGAAEGEVALDMARAIWDARLQPEAA